MKNIIGRTMLLTLLGLSAALPGVADADGYRAIVRARLIGYNEVPALSTPAGGRFYAFIDDHDQTIAYRLVYSGFESAVLQSHLHVGQRHTSGGISAFICTNLGNGPAGTPVCPDPSGVVTGTITAAAVIGPSGQGISAGEFAELVAAIRSGSVYVNVHSEAFPAGQIRGQLR